MEKKTEGIIVEERSDMRGNYLVATGCKEGGYQEEMLKNSKIEGLLAVTGQDFDGRHELWYEVSGLRPLCVKFRQNAPGTEEITQLMQQIGELAVKLEEYLLEPKEVGMELSRIFEGEDGKYLFMYLPGYADFSGGVCRLLEELMEYVDYKNHRAVSFLYLLHAGSRQQSCDPFALYHLCGEILKNEKQEEEECSEEVFFEEFKEDGRGEEKSGKQSGNRSRIRKIMGMREREQAEIKGKVKDEWEKKSSQEKKGNKSRGTESDADGWIKGQAGRKCCAEGEIETEWQEEKDCGKEYRERKWMGHREKNGTKQTEKKGKAGKIQGFFQRFRGYMREAAEAAEDENIVSEYGTYQQGQSACLREQGEYGKYEEELSCSADTVLLAGEEAAETVLLTGNPDTMLLQEERCLLEPQKEGWESVTLTGYPFSIGKERTCDYMLKAPVISRRHAKILREGGRYFLVDTKSLNGTWLNGERLAADEKTEIKNGDRIDFADICFIFTCCKS